MGPGQLKPLPSVGPRTPATSAAPAGCLPAFVVQDHHLSPDFRPGDVLVPVTCAQHAPVLGDYVLADDGGAAGACILRYVAPLDASAAHLTWDGRRYRRLPAAGLRGRILSVRRDGAMFDLAVPAPPAWRRRLSAAGHRLLARLQDWLPSCAGSPRAG